jgi:hypothetical protein
MEYQGDFADYPVKDPAEAIAQIRLRKQIDSVMGWPCKYSLWIERSDGSRNELPLPRDCQ